MNALCTTGVLGLLVCALGVAACRSASRENPAVGACVQDVSGAGVHRTPVASHGGVVLCTGDRQLELVVQPDGLVTVYPSDQYGQPLDPAGVRGTIARRGALGAEQRVTATADRATGALTARLPAPVEPYTDYDVALDIAGRRVATGIEVTSGGTVRDIAHARAAGDQFTPDDQTATPTAIGGGPLSP